MHIYKSILCISLHVSVWILQIYTYKYACIYIYTYIYIYVGNSHEIYSHIIKPLQIQEEFASPIAGNKILGLHKKKLPRCQQHSYHHACPRIQLSGLPN